MPGVSSPLLVGRRDELAVLEAALAAAAAGKPSIVVIGGEAGVGKTRLLAEATRQAAESGTRILSGACLDMGHGGLPFAPLVEALRRFAQETSDAELDSLLGPARHEVGRLLPELALGLASTSDGTTAWPTAGARARLFELLLGMLDRAGQAAPTILVLEDIHWIDAATRDLLTFLAHNLSRERVMLVATHRTDRLGRQHPLPAYLAALEREPRVRRLRLGPLGLPETRLQLAAILGLDPPADLAERIHERAEGNPFFAEELLGAWLRDELSMPDTLRETLGSRLSGLSERAAHLVAAAAVAGRSSDERLLAAAADLEPGRFLEAIREVADREILLPEAGHSYRFRHALLQQVVLEGLLPAERRFLHQRFATVLESEPQLGDPSPAGAKAELAHHWASAELPIEALRASVEAGLAAEEVYAHAQALRHFERALELWSRVPPGERPDSVDRVGLLQHAAEAANLSGQVGRAIALVEEALAALDPEEESVRAAVLHSRLGYLRWAGGQGDEALAAHQEALRLLPPGASRERARILGGLGGALMGSGRYADSALVCQEAISCAREAGAPAEEARALNMLGSDLVALGQADEGLASLREAITLARRAGSADGLIVAYHNLSVTLALEDRYEEALATALEGRAEAPRLGLERRFGPDLLASAADMLYMLGRWDEADPASLEALALAPEGRPPVFGLALRSRLLTARGRVDEATEALTRTQAVERQDLDPDLAAYLALATAELAILEERLDDARAAVQEGLRRLDDSDFSVRLAAPLHALALRAEADRAENGRARRRGTEVGAARTAGEVHRKAVEAQPAPSNPSTVAFLDQARAEWARLLGRPESDLWSAVAERWERQSVPHQAAYARYRQAEALLRSGGGRSPAEEALRAAHRVAVQLGAGPLEAMIADLARRARVTLPEQPTEPAPSEARTAAPDGVTDGGPARPSGSPPRQAPTEELPTVHDLGLSPREIEVLSLVAAGRTNGQIAAELFISPKTAGVHVTHILDKLAVSNRVEAAMVAARLGLASAGPVEGRRSGDGPRSGTGTEGSRS
jgi:DNA-binding CsgD family transcriptional regulator/tetratricopeptide (TPR) repeat protein